MVQSCRIYFTYVNVCVSTMCVWVERGKLWLYKQALQLVVCMASVALPAELYITYVHEHLSEAIYVRIYIVAL